MKCISFKDETGDTIEVGFNFTKEYVTIADGGVEAFIGVKSIDKLIQSLQELKGEINE